ncbi:MAG: hypothetical protein DLM59_08850 [Pseudonocardiales bacterium]|nr:MAG: hypothetical protein DLM59_08850 [Pseudonocardiales bacterium]
MAAEDLLRHCRDLQTGTYEGASGDARQEIFGRAVELLSPVIRAVLLEADCDLLAGTGTITAAGPRPDGQGGTEAVFELSWPAQREASRTRSGRPLEPVRVLARFGAGTQHPHLAGSRAPTDPPGDYPMQVSTGADAQRQRPNIAAIVEAEVHARIFDGGWQVIPAALPPSR